MNMTPTNQLFAVAIAVRPAPANPDFKKFSWALLTIYLHAGNADEAAARAAHNLTALPWSPCASVCQVNLCDMMRDPLPQGVRDAIGLEHVLFRFGDKAPIGAVEPDFENLFRDPVTTKPLL